MIDASRERMRQEGKEFMPTSGNNRHPCPTCAGHSRIDTIVANRDGSAVEYIQMQCIVCGEYRREKPESQCLTNTDES